MHRLRRAADRSHSPSPVETQTGRGALRLLSDGVRALVRALRLPLRGPELLSEALLQFLQLGTAWTELLVREIGERGLDGLQVFVHVGGVRGEVQQTRHDFAILLTIA